MIPTNRRPRPPVRRPFFRRSKTTAKEFTEGVAQQDTARMFDSAESERFGKEIAEDNDTISYDIDDLRGAIARTPADSNRFNGHTFDFTGATTITIAHGLGRIPEEVSITSLDPAFAGARVGRLVIVNADARNVELKAVGFDVDPTVSLRVW